MVHLKEYNQHRNQRKPLHRWKSDLLKDLWYFPPLLLSALRGGWGLVDNQNVWSYAELGTNLSDCYFFTFVSKNCKYTIISLVGFLDCYL
jgi:hypothetical protein